MLAAVADTHTAIWYLFGSDALSEIAKQTIEEAAKDGFNVGVSALSLAEIVYLSEKQRISSETLRRLTDTLANPEAVLTEIPLDSQIVKSMQDIPRADIPDLPDRVIAATGLYFDVPVITRDAKIQAADVKTIW
ncbi:MAG: type II toxin-antitoxin system VapC family toxin [Gemmatimonadetes bacterium]|nr:type II toxin-antitoxin system VapC family toxin [Gemmatimonadota bacterium]MYB58208.1 type II toxin-antitoxin system VapC family toxin [Gemmatimonadota bacterium]MYF16643.1 type II toxin-antitoxin system VapC family toxin [Gemmatimonadota bacterium]MYH46786.1 type II toxin-antitoxin system VapC family toxin [Gammaproteobacteria bacterium]